MRHRKRTVKLSRTSQHRDAMLANMVGSLIQHSRIKTSLAKAKALRPFAEKLVTLAKKGTLHNRRTALARLKGDETAVRKLFADIAPRFQERQGGYTRILKLGQRRSDATHMALIEWVDFITPVIEEDEPQKPTKKKTAAKTAEETPAEPAAEEAPKAKKKSAKKED